MRIQLFLAASLLGIASTAAAQQYDANCRPATFTEDQQFEQEVCKSHAGCAMVFNGLQKVCSGVDFLRNIGDKITGTKPLTNDDVFDASEPQFPKSSFTNTITSKIKSVTEGVFASKPETGTYRAGDGSFGYSETLPAGDGRREGTVIYSDGSKSRGQYTENWQLNGAAEFVTSKGAIQAGNFNNGALSGEGFKTEPTGKSADVYEGTFDNGVPVGEVVHRFPDGTSVREIWRNGKMIRRGQLAAKGKVPPPVPDESGEADASANGTAPNSSSRNSEPEVPESKRYAGGIWTPALGEGLRISRDNRDGWEVVELWCSHKFVTQGKYAPPGKALPPTQKTCPTPRPDGNYFNQAQGRWEFWCSGKLAEAVPGHRGMMYYPRMSKCPEKRELAKTVAAGSARPNGISRPAPIARSENTYCVQETTAYAAVLQPSNVEDAQYVREMLTSPSDWTRLMKSSLDFVQSTSMRGGQGNQANLDVNLLDKWIEKRIWQLGNRQPGSRDYTELAWQICIAKHLGARLRSGAH